MGQEHSVKNYYRTYVILLILFVISVCGPWLGIKTVTLITAFGVAFIKAYLVIRDFMHLTVEKRYIIYIMATMLIACGLFYAGTSPDVMTPGGANWIRL